jgi:hypothetical protein
MTYREEDFKETNLPNFEEQNISESSLKLPRRIYWDSTFYSRDIILKNVMGEVVGNMRFRLFSFDMDVEFKGKAYLFEEKGFFKKNIDIYEDGIKFIASVSLVRNYKEAKLKFIDGKEFLWKKLDFLGRKWEMIRDYPDSIYDPVVLTFTKTSFWEMDGRINNEEIMGEEEILVALSGLYIGLYYRIKAASRKSM